MEDAGMTTSEERHKAALDLAPEERVTLGNRLIDSARDGEQEPEYDEAWTDEIRRRIADDDADPDDAIPWEQIRKELFAGLEDQPAH